MSSTWFKRIKKGILTNSKDKKNVPDGLWFKCPSCKKTSTNNDIKNNLWVCDDCGYHIRIDAAQYFQIIYDEGTINPLFENIVSTDKLGFVDLKPYKDRLVDAQKQTGLGDAMSVAAGEVFGRKLVTAAMNFSFIGGSMGSVVGEKVARAIDYAIEHRMPLLIISKSGGARMMESAFSLMQMAKTSANLLN
jgi:Acetyl-CoA carboxylase beta subunit